MPASEEAAKAAREKWRAPRITEAAMAERATVGPGLAPAELSRTTHRLLKWRFCSVDLDAACTGPEFELAVRALPE